MMGHRYDICAVVVGDLATDARVWREARTLNTHGFSVALIGCRYEIDRLQRRTVGGIDVVEVPLGSRSGTVSRLGRARTLLRLWGETLATPAGAYHIHNIHPGPAAALAAKLRRARFVYDAHELYGNAEPRTPMNVVAAAPPWLLERFLVRHATAVITTNRSRADELRARHGRRELVVLANVPDRVVELRPSPVGFPPEKPVLLYQGGVYARERAFRETIEALSMVDELHFVVIGFGRDHDRELVRQWAEELGVADRVHLLGARPFDDLVHIAASATVGLVPIKPNHRSDLLGDTNKLHEYLMAGLPVVASDLPEIRRVVTDGDPPVGELFDPQSPGSIARAIERVRSDPHRYQARAREARRLALERHNWQAQEAQLTRIYDALAAERARGTSPIGARWQ
ncbi:MAG: glycosyltransferase [Solirubrobacterales bacterium]|nr:glycosyltransferase [Solirubrobacterales bacterium]